MKFGTSIKRTLMILSMVLLTMGSYSGAVADGTTVNQLISDAVEQFNMVADYTCRLNKKVRKNNMLCEDRNISVKYKKPRHYYFRWTSGMAERREVIFVEGKNDDRIIAHPGGLLKFMTFRLEPDGYMAMKENHHSLKSSGMEKIITLIKSNTALADAKGLEVIRFIGEGCFDGKRTRVVEGCFPKDKGFCAHRIRLYFYPAVKLPLKVSIYD